MTKEITSNIIVAVGTAVIMAIIGWAAGVFEKGQAAIDKEQIRTVIEEEMKTDSGKTYGAVLDELVTAQGVTNAQMQSVSEGLGRVESAIMALAAD